MIDGAKNHVAQSSKVLTAISVVFDGIAGGETAAVDPEHHGPPLTVTDGGRVNVDAETILVNVAVVPTVAEGIKFVGVLVLHRLRGHIAPPERRVYVAPRFGCLGRHEPVRSGGIGAIGDTKEVVDAPEHVPSDLPISGIGYRDVIADEKNLLVRGHRNCRSGARERGGSCRRADRNSGRAHSD